MELRKSGKLYRLAYLCTDEKEMPDKTNLCKFFWRVVIGIPLQLLFTIVIFIVAGVVVSILWLGALTLFAYRPTFDKKKMIKCDDGTHLPVTLITWWPKFRGRRIWPITILSFLAGLCLVVYLCVVGLPLLLTWTTGPPPVVSLGSIAVLLVLVMVFRLVPRIRDSETWQVFKAYVKAKKRKVCPIIVFVDDEKASV